MTRHLLIDGYNVLHAWTWLGRHANGSTAAATQRTRLVAAAQAIHDAEGLAVTVVFDGSGRADRDVAAEAASDVEVCFAPAGLTADGVIERAVARAEAPDACVVATDDHLVQETVRAAGGAVVSTAELAAWVQRSRGRAREAARRRGAARANDFSNRLPL